MRYSNDSGNELDFGHFHQRPAGADVRVEELADQADLADAIVSTKPRAARRNCCSSWGVVAHIAVDDAEAAFCTELKGVVVPAVQPGLEQWRGQPPNPDGLKTDYLWKQVLTRESLANIIESYAQVVEEKKRMPAARNARSANRSFRVLSAIAHGACLPLRRAHTDGWASYLIQHRRQAAARATRLPGWRTNW